MPFVHSAKFFYYSFGSVSAQRWAFIASPGARVRFSILEFEQARGSSIMQFAQRSVFSTASRALALSDGFLLRHRECEYKLLLN